MKKNVLTPLVLLLLPLFSFGQLQLVGDADIQMTHCNTISESISIATSNATGTVQYEWFGDMQYFTKENETSYSFGIIRRQENFVEPFTISVGCNAFDLAEDTVVKSWSITIYPNIYFDYFQMPQSFHKTCGAYMIDSSGYLTFNGDGVYEQNGAYYFDPANLATGSHNITWASVYQECPPSYTFSVKVTDDSYFY